MLSPDDGLHPEPNPYRKACDEGIKEVEVTTEAVNVRVTYQEPQNKSEKTQFKEEGVEEGEEGVDEGSDDGEHVVDR